jgi:hypothetical protein
MLWSEVVATNPGRAANELESWFRDLIGQIVEEVSSKQYL